MQPQDPNAPFISGHPQSEDSNPPPHPFPDHNPGSAPFAQAPGLMPEPQQPTPIPPAPSLPPEPAPAPAPQPSFGQPVQPMPPYSPQSNFHQPAPQAPLAPHQPQPPQPLPGTPMGPSLPPQHPPFAAASHNNKKKLLVLVIGILAVLILLAAAAFIAVKMIRGTVKLETFSNENVSMLVPAGYKKTDENGGATFEETEGADNTHSEVIVFYEKLPSGLSASDLSQLSETLKEMLRKAADETASTEGEKIVNVKIVDTTFKGDKAFKLTADAERNGKRVGSYTLIAGLNTKAVYLAGVGAHSSDPGLAKQVDKIINSFELK